ncbi:DNA-binding transcriptional regulator, MerR family [Nakamurella panacisegetis]|uniref:DNA-binding transcriptional regulator, MerR family n=1 Tax=Nakamurella panacisegetis TaxID=1090615 RepID=A0A1H0KT95_9ACTN|nr:MerR family transcriptional regulator [Nakamurella panacisegetis]SDO59187.1 DNA-binding transcriptional regulator, MerR family [Nakamurella panacisegetis]
MSISDAAAMAGVTAHTLRYYERVALLDPVAKNEAGRRRFTERDLARIEFISRLRATGMPIRQVRRYVELIRAGEHTEPERIALLEAHRLTVKTRLAEIQASLDTIDSKIANYRTKRVRRIS